MSRLFAPLRWCLLASLALAAVACSDDSDSGTTKTDTAAATDAGADTGDGVDLADTATTTKADVKLLLFSKTAGFRHESIDAALAALKGAAGDHGWTVEATEDASRFSAEGLAGIDAVVFVMTTGDVLDATQQAAFEAYVKAGGGFAGVHSATDTEAQWPFYVDHVGATFKDHTNAGTPGVVNVLDRAHPATAELPLSWKRNEEWYAFTSNPRGKVHVLATVRDGAMGHDHPHAWCQVHAGGRSFYTAGGHDAAAWSEPAFLQHVTKGIDWAAGRVDGDCAATIDKAWSRETLAEGLQRPMELEVAPNGDAYWIQRSGELRRYNAATSKVEEVGKLDVETAHEDGLLGLALDPDFATNARVWLFHSVKTPSENWLSSFVLKAGKLDAASIKTVIKVPVERALCCHSSGALEFGPGRMLFVTTGDNTNPWSTGYAPIDGRKDKTGYDARRSAGNPDDLRGKILRVHANADGSIDLPGDNLYSKGGGAKEVYILGVRNPFRAKVDAKTSRLWWCETGPDAKTDDAAKGPKGYDEVNFADAAGNFGWPFCIANNLAYGKVDFETDTASGKYDCAALVNDSPNVSKPATLGAARPALVYYPYDDIPAFPAIAGGGPRTALFALIHRGKAAGVPPYLEGLPVFMDWSRNRFYAVHQDESDAVMALVQLFKGVEFTGPMDVDVGPDGQVYVLEFGKGWEGTDGARLSRLVYKP